MPISVPMVISCSAAGAPYGGTLPDLVLHILTVTITSFTLEPGSPLAGTTPGGFNLRKRYNLFVPALRRGEEMTISLFGETRLEAGDIAIIYASPEDIAKGADLFIHPDLF